MRTAITINDRICETENLVGNRIVVLKHDAEPGVRTGMDAGVEAATIKDLQDFVKQAIAPYKYPRIIEFCRSLPRTESGKLQRYKLKDGN